MSILTDLYGPASLRRLQELEARAADYQAADPFPHMVVDDFLPPAALQAVVDAFPAPRALAYREYDDDRQVKLEYTRVEVLPEPCRDLLFFLNSAPVLRMLEAVTGIAGLIPDPYLVGGGLHQIEPGGKLDVHADFNRLDKLKLDRRLNLIVYLNQNWREEYGGHLELWDTAMTRCAKKVLPVFNRCVVFSTTSDSYHGHPLPLACPKGMTRKSMALYYYTNGRPEEEKRDAHSTLFRTRPGQPQPRRSGLLQALKRVAAELLPPIVTRAFQRLAGRR